MKSIQFCSLLMLFTHVLLAQNSDMMKQEFISTNMGSIAVYQRIVPNTVPIIFLHGVYYDHSLWNYFSDQMNDRTVITIDMPLHGLSKEITLQKWTLDDCANMLLQIVDSLGYRKVFAIGHSWGSMTVLRAAVKSPDRFESIGLCNMPFEKTGFGTQVKFAFQHLLLPFRDFYAGQVAKAMFAKESRSSNPEKIEYLKRSMSQLSNEEVKQTDRSVILTADSGREYLDRLATPAMALHGGEDYVGTPPNIETTIVAGAHTSPLEQQEEVLRFIKRVIAQTDK